MPKGLQIGSATWFAQWLCALVLRSVLYSDLHSDLRSDLYSDLHSDFAKWVCPRICHWRRDRASGSKQKNPRPRKRIKRASTVALVRMILFWGQGFFCSGLLSSLAGLGLALARLRGIFRIGNKNANFFESSRAGNSRLKVRINIRLNL